MSLIQDVLDEFGHQENVTLSISQLREIADEIMPKKKSLTQQDMIYAIIAFLINDATDAEITDVYCDYVEREDLA
jgi:hypothetical protein